MRFCLLIPVCIALATYGCAGVSPQEKEDASDSPVFTEVSKLARRIVAKTPVTGLSVILIDGSDVVGAAGFGYADAEAGVPATENTVYRGGSLAKLFTATAVMQLHEREGLDLDEPLIRSLPGFAIPNRSGDDQAITARSLLSHHSGLASDIDQGMWSRTPFTNVVDRLKTEVAPYSPGEVTAYSNVGYCVLGKLLETVGNEPFETRVAREVFKPLKMASTGYATDAPPGIARGYRGGKAGDLLPIRDTPAMGLYTTASDLGLYLTWLLSDGRNTVLSRAAREEMWTPQNGDIALDFDARVGLAWLLDEVRLGYAGRVARHGGQTPRFSSEIMVLPDHRLGVAVLANAGNAEGVVRFLAARALRIALKAKSGIEPPPRSKPPKVVAASIPTDAAGRYATEFGILRVDPEAERLHAETLERTYPLVSYADGTFGVSPKALKSARDKRLRALAKIRFKVRQRRERQFLLAYAGNKIRLFGEPVPQSNAEKAWQARLGTYRVANADPRFPVEGLTLREMAETLYLEYRLPTLSDRRILRPIAPLDDTYAVTLGVGRSREVLSIEEGTQTLRFSGYRAIKEVD